MADPGKMALLLELTLSADAALDTLDKIYEKFEKIEKSIEKISGSFAAATKDVADLGKSLKDFDAAAIKLTSKELAKFSKQAKVAAQATADIGTTAMAAAKDVADLGKSLKDLDAAAIKTATDEFAKFSDQAKAAAQATADIGATAVAASQQAAQAAADAVQAAVDAGTTAVAAGKQAVKAAADAAQAAAGAQQAAANAQKAAANAAKANQTNQAPPPAAGPSGPMSTGPVIDFTDAAQFAQWLKTGIEDGQQLSEVLRNVANGTMLAANLSEDLRQKLNASREAQQNWTSEQWRHYNAAMETNAELKKTNAAYTKTIEKMQSESAARAAAIGSIMDTAASKVKGVAGLFEKVSRGIKAGWGPLTFLVIGLEFAVHRVTELMDAFSAANYRAAGSIDAMTTASTWYQASLAGSAEDVNNAMKAVFEAGFRAQSAQADLIPTVFMMKQALGVSEATSAQYAQTLVMMGGNAADAADNLDFAAKAIGKAGLSAAEATALVEKMNEAMMNFYAMTGDRTAAEAAGKDMAMFASLARDAQVPVGKALDALGKLQTGGTDMIRMMGSAAILSADASERTLIAMNQASDVIAQTADLPPAIREKVIAARTGMSAAEITTLDAIVKKMKDTYGVTGPLTKEHWEKYREEIKESQALDELYASSLETITGIFQQVLIPILQMVMAAILPFFNLLKFLLTPVIVLMDGIRALISLIQKLIPPEVLNLILMLAAALLLMTTPMKGIILTMTILAGVFKFISYLANNFGVVGKIVAGILAFLAIAFTVATIKNITFMQTLGLTRGLLSGVGGALVSFGKTLFTVLTNPKKAWTDFKDTMSTVADTAKNVLKQITGGEMPGKGLFDKFRKPEGGAGPDSDAMYPLVGMPKGDEAGPSKGFFKTLKEGLMEFSKDEKDVIKGALVFSAVIFILGLPMVLLAGLMSKMKVTGTEMIGAVAAMVVGLFAFKMMGKMAEGAGESASKLIPTALKMLVAAALLGVGFTILGLAFKVLAWGLEAIADPAMLISVAIVAALVWGLSLLGGPAATALVGAVILLAVAFIIYPALLMLAGALQPMADPSLLFAAVTLLALIGVLALLGGPAIIAILGAGILLAMAFIIYPALLMLAGALEPLADPNLLTAAGTLVLLISALALLGAFALFAFLGALALIPLAGLLFDASNPLRQALVAYMDPSLQEGANSILILSNALGALGSNIGAALAGALGLVLIGLALASSTVAIAIACAFFPSDDLVEVSNAIKKFTDTVSTIPPGIGDALNALGESLDLPENMEDNMEDLVDALEEFEDAEEPLKKVLGIIATIPPGSSRAFGEMAKTFGMIPDNIEDKAEMFADALEEFEDLEINIDPLQQMATVLAKVAEEMGKIASVDLYQALAGKIIDNADKFSVAAKIIADYNKSLGENTSNIMALKDANAVAALTAGGEMESSKTTKAEPVATAKKDVKEEKVIDQNSAIIERLEKQTKILEKISGKDNAKTEQRLDALIKVVKEIVEHTRRDGSTHPASQW